MRRVFRAAMTHMSHAFRGTSSRFLHVFPVILHVSWEATGAPTLRDRRVQTCFALRGEHAAKTRQCANGAPTFQDAKPWRNAMSEGNNQVDPTRLSLEQAAKLLSAAFRERIEPEEIRLDVQEGAPVNVDGTINLVHYSAWQAKEMGRGE